MPAKGTLWDRIMARSCSLNLGHPVWSWWRSMALACFCPHVTDKDPLVPFRAWVNVPRPTRPTTVSRIQRFPRFVSTSKRFELTPPTGQDGVYHTRMALLHHLECVGPTGPVGCRLCSACAAWTMHPSVTSQLFNFSLLFSTLPCNVTYASSST